VKKIILLFSAVWIFAACNNEANTKDKEYAKNTDIIGANLKGKVQSYTETTYIVDSTGKQKMDSLLNINELDEKGYQTKFSTKDSVGKIHTVQTFTRNDIGAFTEMVTMKDGKQMYKLVTEIDKDGKYSGGKSYDSTGKQDGYYKDLKTNEYGVVYGGKLYGMNNKIKSTFDMKYDKAYFVGGSSTDSAGRTTYSGTLKLNDKNDPVEETSTTLVKDSSITEKMTYKYDSFDNKGNWIQRTTYNEKGKPSKIIKRTFSYYKD